MTVMSVDARLDGPGVAVDLDEALSLLSQADQLRAEAAMLLGGLEGSGLAQWLGYVSLERLVAHRAGCGNAGAHGLLRVARHLDRFGATADGLKTGRVGWAHVEVLAKAAVGLADAYETDELELLDVAERCEVEELERLCQVWRARVDAEAAAQDAQHRFQTRGVWLQYAFDGSCHGRLRLDADDAEVVAQALESPPDPVSVTEPRTLAQRRADTLVDLCRSEPGEHKSRVSVDVVVDVETLAGVNGPVERARSELARGAPISGPGLDRLLCDASYRALVTDGVSTPTVSTPSSATPNSHQSILRCEFRLAGTRGGRRRRPHCDLHHLKPRHQGGPTTIKNLALVCRFHHRLIHEGGWQLTRAPNGHHHTTSP